MKFNDVFHSVSEVLWKKEAVVKRIQISPRVLNGIVREVNVPQTAREILSILEADNYNGILTMQGFQWQPVETCSDYKFFIEYQQIF